MKSDKHIEENGFEAIQVRIARPTRNLALIKEWYTKGLGLNVLGEFEGHDGYAGIMLGMPNAKAHLEFTSYDGEMHISEPTKENLIVLYYDSEQKFNTANQRLRKFGVTPVEPENPYWVGKSFTYEDPDKWRVVLFNGLYEQPSVH